MIQARHRIMATFRIKTNEGGQKIFMNCQIKMELLINSVVK